MKTFNRRSFARSAAASAILLAVPTQTGVLAQPTRNDRQFESELTGSVIELIDDAYVFNDDSYEMREDPDFVVEYLSISNGSSTVEIEFVQTSLSAEDFLATIQESYSAGYDAFEVADSGSTNDGAWFAASAAFQEFSLSVFCEYQSGAYEEADLVVILNSRPDEFLNNLDALQSGISIGDLEPMMMIETSEIASLEFPELAVAVPTQTETTNSRNTRGSNSSSSTSEQRNTRSTDQTETTTTTDADNSYVDAIIDHRSRFMTSFEEFATALATFGDETATDAQLDSAISTIDQVANQWTSYPSEASQLTAPADFGNLESLYITWSNEIGALGSTWLDVRNQVAQVDALFTQIDVVDRADQALVAELNSL